MKKKKMSYQWVEMLTSLYMVFMFGIFPLYFQDSYLDILRAKTYLFKRITVFYLIAGVILIWLVSVFKAEEERKLRKKIKKEDKKKENYKMEHIMFVLFFSTVIASTFLSGDIQNAWESPNGKLFGTVIIMLCCGIYCMAQRGYLMNWWVKASLLIGIGTVSMLTILNRYGIDPLDMYSRIIEKQKPIYLSTIGNVNILSNFLCIFLPIFFGCVMYCKGRKEIIVCAFLAYLSCMAGIGTNSDSFFLGLAGTMIFLLWYGLETKEYFRRYIVLCMLCAMSFLSLEFMNQISTYEYRWYKLQRTLINEIPWLGVILTLVVLYWFVGRIKEEHYVQIRKITFSILGIAAVVLLVYIIILNMGDVDGKSGMLIFNDSWGTNRGYVWKRTWKLYKELPFMNKLIGIGPGGFKEFFSIYNVERSQMGATIFTDPHSEALYYLISTGIIGAISYFGMLFASIKSCLKKNSNSSIILATVFVSWIAQGMVNNPLVFTTPYIFLLMGISSYETRDIKTNKCFSIDMKFNQKGKERGNHD